MGTLTIQVDNPTQFINNTASVGGAIHMQNMITLNQLWTSDFFTNSATQGGAISLQSSTGILSIDGGVKFQGNTAASVQCRWRGMLCCLFSTKVLLFCRSTCSIPICLCHNFHSSMSVHDLLC